MKADQLFEAPLPDDWDSKIFDPRVPFKTRVDYAKERAEQIGRGSSRVAFKLPYQGRETVLKIAMNRKGASQNDEESQLLDDWYVKSIGNVIPVIDYDESGSYPTWIHTEYATKITQKQLERFFGGVSMDFITSLLDTQQGRRRGVMPMKLPEVLEDNDNFMMLQELVGNFGLPAGDFARKANWGLYKGQPVIIDLGYTDTSAVYYR